MFWSVLQYSSSIFTKYIFIIDISNIADGSFLLLLEWKSVDVVLLFLRCRRRTKWPWKVTSGKLSRSEAEQSRTPTQKGRGRFLFLLKKFRHSVPVTEHVSWWPRRDLPLCLLSITPVSSDTFPPLFSSSSVATREQKGCVCVGLVWMGCVPAKNPPHSMQKLSVHTHTHTQPAWLFTGQSLVIRRIKGRRQEVKAAWHAAVHLAGRPSLILSWQEALHASQCSVCSKTDFAGLF